LLGGRVSGMCSSGKKSSIVADASSASSISRRGKKKRENLALALSIHNKL
jgi:hypothetical protein